MSKYPRHLTGETEVMAGVANSKQWNGEPCLLEAGNRLFGGDARELLWREFGGLSLYVPKSPRIDHPISRTIGVERAILLAQELGGITVNVPRHPSRSRHWRREIVRRLSLDGKPSSEIAKAADCNQRTVHRLRALLRQEGKLPPG